MIPNVAFTQDQFKIRLVNFKSWIGDGVAYIYSYTSSVMYCWTSVACLLLSCYGFVSQLRMRGFTTFNVVLFVQSYKLVHHVFISVVTYIYAELSILWEYKSWVIAHTADYKGPQNITSSMYLLVKTTNLFLQWVILEAGVSFSYGHLCINTTTTFLPYFIVCIS